MKTASLTTILVVSSCLAASAFGVKPVTSLKLRTDSAVGSPLFRDAVKVRGGAVPGWAAYNEALDKSPLTAKACTSLAGWALGDILAQVRDMRWLNSSMPAFGWFHRHFFSICLFLLLCRSSSLEDPSTLSASSLFLPLVCFTTGPLDTTFTTGSIKKSRELTENPFS
jgi:hypothetical protein